MNFKGTKKYIQVKEVRKGKREKKNRKRGEEEECFNNKNSNILLFME